MMEKPYLMARSLAGHDKDHLYIVTRVDGEFYYLVNGGTRPLDKPKKKKKKHLQLICHLPEDIRQAMEQIEKDHDVVRIIKMMNKEADTCLNQM